VQLQGMHGAAAHGGYSVRQLCRARIGSLQA